jgi:AcrR family transcriptional regulator
VSGTRRVSVGRPPDPEADERILAAAQKLLTTEGFARMSIEAVASESGVAKTTIYRRYSDKVALATAAIAEMIPVAVPRSTGNAYEDLVAQLEFNRRTIDVGLPGALLAEERRSPQVLAAFRAGVVAPRVEIFEEILTAGIEAGDLRADLDFDAAFDLIFGTIFAHYVAKGPPAADWPRRVIDAIWPAIKAT